ncbi:MAG: hypothetical protein LBB20_01845, partial [Puniceicoccales bacterium]|nr:hypothetical protein [Puniceicoccales bacterium]
MDGIIIKRASFYVLCFSLIGINVPPSVIAGSSSFIKFKNWFRAPTNTKPTDYVHNDDSEAKLESIKTAFKLLTSIAFYEIEIAHKKLPKLDPNDEKNVNLQSKINLFKDEILPQYYKKITHENDLAALKHSLTEFINNISALDDTIGKNIGGLQKLKKVFDFNNYGKISSAIKNFRNELHSLSESRTEEKLNNIKNETLAKCTKIMMANGLDYANQEKLMNDTLALFNIGVYNILKAYMRSCLKNNTSHNDAQNQVILNMEAYIDKKIAPPMDKLCDFIKISCGSYKNINDKVSGTTRTQDSVLKDFGNNSYMYLNMMTHINSRADVINKILIGIKSFLTQAHNGYFTKDVKHMENVKYDIPYDIRYGFNKLVSFLTLINVDRLYSYNEYEKLYRSIELIRSATVMLKSMYEFCNSYNVNMFCIDFDTIQ